MEGVQKFKKQVTSVETPFDVWLGLSLFIDKSVAAANSYCTIIILHPRILLLTLLL